MYIHEQKDWPHFRWDELKLSSQIANIRHQQGRLIGKMGALGFQYQQEAVLQTLTEDVLKSSEIEGEVLNKDQVRSSVARRLGMDIAGLTAADRHVDGVVEMMLDATQNYQNSLSKDRLYAWHSALFPTGRSGMHKIIVGRWRNDAQGPMRVISGPMGKEKVHYIAPDAPRLENEMLVFLKWFNASPKIDLVAQAALAHLWFVTIHPFDDGNGRIARAIADLVLARSELSSNRFYSMSAQIRAERNVYYDLLESTQKGTLDVTTWMEWFLSCLGRALENAEFSLSNILMKAKFWEIIASEPVNERQKKILNFMLDDFEGILTSSKWAKITKCSQDTAHRDILNLIDRKIFAKDKGGGRSTSYSLSEELLDKIKIN